MDNNTNETLIQAIAVEASEKDLFREGVGKTLGKAAKKKKRNIALYWSLKRLGQIDKARRVRSCGTWVAFGKAPSGRARLLNINSCGYKLCPVCQWRKGLRTARKLSLALDEAEKMQEGMVPLFLTLTMRNCKGEDLPGALDSIFQGWNRINSNDRIKRIVRGWFRSLEITYNREDKTYHPHLHVVLLVGKGYFEKDYITTEGWVRLWQKATRADYSPVCDIRRIYGDRQKSVAEIAKYVAKDSHYLYSDKSLTDEVVSTLDSALHRRRLIAYGGVLKEAKAVVDKREDLRKRKAREGIAEAVEEYSWRFRLEKYVLIPARKTTEAEAGARGG